MPGFTFHLSLRSPARWPLWLLSLLFAPWLVNRLGPEFLDADSLIPTLASTQHLTLFYWGNDRLANVLPLLFSPVVNLTANLYLHLFANSAAYLLLLEAISDVACRLSGSTPTLRRRALLFSLLLVLPMALWQPFALYQFAVSAQPYALSFVLLLWSGAAWLRRRTHQAFLVPCLLFLSASLGLNFAIVLIPLALFVYAAWTRRVGSWLGFIVLSFGVFAVWSAVSRSMPRDAPSPYLAFYPELIPDMLQKSMTDIRNKAIHLPAFALLAPVAMLAARSLPREVGRALGLTLAFGIAWWVLFLSNHWVQMNDVAFRYFMPLLFGPVVAIAVAIGLWLDAKATPASQRAVLAACLVVATVLVERPWTPIVHYRAFEAAKAPLETARRRQIRYFAGDYWLVWPVIFSLRNDGLPALGAFSRGIALKEQIRSTLQADVRRGVQPLVQCVNMPPPTCQDQVQRVTGYAWQLANVPAEGPSQFLRLASRSP